MRACRAGRSWSILLLGVLLLTGVVSLAMGGCRSGPKEGSLVFYEFFDPT